MALVTLAYIKLTKPRQHRSSGVGEQGKRQLDQSFNYKEYSVLTSPDAKLHEALVLTVYISWCLLPSHPFWKNASFHSESMSSACIFFLKF